MALTAASKPRTLLRLAGYLKPYGGRLIGAVLALLVAAGGVLAIGQGLRLVIDHGFRAGDPEMLNQALLVTLGLVVVLAVAAALRYYWITWVGERLAADLRTHVFERLLYLEPDFFERNGAGEIQSRITADTTVLQTLFGVSLSMAIRNTLMFFGALTLLLITSPQLTALVLIGIPLILIPILWFGRRVRKLSRSSQDRIADLGSYAGEALHAIPTLQACGHEAIDRRDYAERVEEAFSTAIERTRQRAWLAGTALLFVFAAVGVILWLGGHAVLEGRMTAGELSAFVFYAILAASSVAAVAEVAGDVLRGSGAAERLLELIDAEPQIYAPPQPRTLPEPIRGELRFVGVDFSYPSRPQRPVLEQLSFTALPGERIALVGPSGAGKSTVIQLLLRFYDPAAGSVQIDGIDLRELDPHAVRRQIGVVTQEPVLFTGTVADNIRYGRPDADDDAIFAAAEDANALAFIERLPDGMQTALGPGGVQLSGGQRQRIAIARAILRDPVILLLDEATSALDAESERAVQQALERLTGIGPDARTPVGRTSLVIAHRLSTVAAADSILVLNEGRLEAQGTHAELLADSPLYRRLAALQLSADDEGC